MEISLSKPKVVILLGSHFHLRSFIACNLYEVLSQSYDPQVLISQDVASKPISLDFPFRQYSVPKVANSLFTFLLNVYMLSNFKISSSFRLRLRRSIFGDYQSFPPIHFGSLIRILAAAFVMITPLKYLLKEVYGRIVELSIRNLMDESNKYAFIISWAQSLEPNSIAAIRIAKRFNSQSILVFDNWDNLSSKSVLFEFPSFIFCFGEQSRDFAHTIHRFPRNRVFPIGSARFDVYQNMTLKTDRDRKCILVAGSSLAMEDFSILDALDQIIQDISMNSSLTNYNFVYRPHPAPQGLNVDLENWRYDKILLDDPYKLKENQYSTFAPQESIASILSKQALVIGSPTTLILEALLCKIPVIVPLFGRKGVKTTNELMVRELEHLKHLRYLKNVYFCSDVISLKKKLIRLVESQSPFDEDEEVEHVVTTKPGSFSERFVLQLDSLQKL